MTLGGHSGLWCEVIILLVFWVGRLSQNTSRHQCQALIQPRQYLNRRYHSVIMIKLGDLKGTAGGGKANMHEALRRNFYVLPELKKRMVTVDYLREVYNGSTFAIKLSERFPNAYCHDPPSANALKMMLVEFITTNQATLPPNVAPRIQRLLFHLRKGNADKAYYLEMLAKFTDGQHRIFNKDYLRANDKPDLIQNLMVDNPNGLFDNLPPSKSKGKLNPKLFVSEERLDMIRLQQMEVQQRKTEQKAERQRQELANLQAYLRHKADMAAQADQIDTTQITHQTEQQTAPIPNVIRNQPEVGSLSDLDE